jgi:hypothetical protein
MGDHTKVFAPVIDLDQTEHIYDNRYKRQRRPIFTDKINLVSSLVGYAFEGCSEAFEAFCG